MAMTPQETATAWCEMIAKDNSHGYDQIYRWGKDYDCSSLVITAYEFAGVPVKTKGATYTGNMQKVFKKCGFKDVTRNIVLSTGSGLIRGDVLFVHNKYHQHTALYCGNNLEVEASINEKGTATSGQTGDQTGREILIRPYRRNFYTTVLRYSKVTADDTLVKLANEVIQGRWGNGSERERRLKAAGYNYDEVQRQVNRILRGE